MQLSVFIDRTIEAATVIHRRRGLTQAGHRGDGTVISKCIEADAGGSVKCHVGQAGAIFKYILANRGDRDRKLHLGQCFTIRECAGTDGLQPLIEIDLSHRNALIEGHIADADHR